jgi:hypothetical protein
MPKSDMGGMIPFGAGSGGDASDGAKFISAEKTLILGGNHVAIQADTPTPPASADAPLVTVLSSDITCQQGRVEVHAPQSVRITTTGGIPGLIPMHSDSTNGIEICAGDPQTVLITRGSDENPMQGRIAMNLDGIGINGTGGGVWIKSLTSIKLAVAGGTSSITLTPAGIVMQGPLITIN